VPTQKQLQKSEELPASANKGQGHSVRALDAHSVLPHEFSSSDLVPLNGVHSLGTNETIWNSSYRLSLFSCSCFKAI